MSYPVFTVPAGTTLYLPFATYGGANGQSITLTGLAASDIEVYKNGSTTQRASDAGYTLLDTDGIDFDGITGIHGFSIDLSDNTDAGFYAVGSWYFVVVSAVTVDTQTVNFIAGVFRITPAEGVAGYPKADVSHFGGSAGTFASGRPEVNTSHFGGSAGAFASGRPEVNASHFGGSAGTFASGRPEVNASHVGGTSQTGRDLGASVLLSAGTGTGQLDITSGVVKANLVQILATALTETAGLIAAGFKKFFNVASPTGTVNSLPDAVPGAANGVLIAGTNAPVTITGSGNALTLTSTGANGHGLAATGHGTGAGLAGTGGSTSGPGLYGKGGGTGSGVFADSGAGASGDGITARASSTDGYGLNARGAGGLYGVLAKGGANGHGLAAVGGDTQGNGLYAVGIGADKHGISASGGTGAAHGMNLTAGSAGAPLGFSGPQIGSSGNDSTHVHLSSLTFGDDEINDCLLVIEDNSEGELHLRWIEDWVASTKLATVAALPFTPAGASDRAALVPLTRRDVALMDGAITAAKIASDAITAAKIAADAITAAKIAADAITAAKIASNALTDAKFDSTGVLRAHLAAVLKTVVGTGSTTTAVKLSTVSGAAPSASNDFYNGRVLVFTSGTLAGQATSISDYDGATTTATVVALTAAPSNADTAVLV